MMTIRGISVPQEAGDLRIFPDAGPQGSLLPIRDRHGDTWHGASLIVHGQRGGFVAALSLHRSDLRELASAASLTADWIDARERGEAGPCLCHAWRHGPAFPCPNRAADDSTYCRTCWTPDEGMQGHEERWA